MDSVAKVAALQEDKRQYRWAKKKDGTWVKQAVKTWVPEDSIGDPRWRPDASILGISGLLSAVGECSTRSLDLAWDEPSWPSSPLDEGLLLASEATAT